MGAAAHERGRARERVRALRAAARRDRVVRPPAAPAGRPRPAAAGLRGHRYPAAPMTAAVRAVAAAALIAAPTVLAFFTGGFRDDARLVAGIVVWLLVILAAVFAGGRFRARRRARGDRRGGAAGHLDGLSRRGRRCRARRWTTPSACCCTWARWWRPRRCVVPGRRARSSPGWPRAPWSSSCYGLSERLLPGLVELDRSALRRRAARAAAHLLERGRPCWPRSGSCSPRAWRATPRATGALRLRRRGGRRAARRGRVPDASRAGARGAAAGLGLVALLAPTTRPVAPAAPCCAARRVLAAVGGRALFAGLRTLEGSVAAREPRAPSRWSCCGAPAVRGRLAVRRGSAGAGDPSVPRRVHRVRRRGGGGARRSPFVALSWSRPPRRRESARPRRAPPPSRLASAQSNRYALLARGARHVRRPSGAGIGSGGFRVSLAREARHLDDRHATRTRSTSRPPRELGLVGLAPARGADRGRSSRAARRMLRGDREAAVAGPIAALALSGRTPGSTGTGRCRRCHWSALALAGAMIAWSELRAARRAAFALGRAEPAQSPGRAPPRPLGSSRRVADASTAHATRCPARAAPPPPASRAPLASAASPSSSRDLPSATPTGVGLRNRAS